MTEKGVKEMQITKATKSKKKKKGKGLVVGAGCLMKKRKAKVLVSQLCPTLCDPMGLWPTRLLCLW